MFFLECKTRFQIYIYTSTHNQLLFRSLPKDDNDKKIEILLSNVKYVSVPSVFNDLIVREISRDMACEIFSDLHDFRDLNCRFFRFFGEGWSGFVAAENICWSDKGWGADGGSKLLGPPYVGGHMQYNFRHAFGRLLFFLRNRRF